MLTRQRRLLAKLRLHLGAMAGRAVAPHACWWPSREVAPRAGKWTLLLSGCPFFSHIDKGAIWHYY